LGPEPRKRTFDVTPSARRLTDSLRDIGYDFQSAVADLIDNSVSAGARRIDILMEFDGPASYVIIADDGGGMTDGELTEARRFGTRRDYERNELGRYGLGLKTASISQCRRLTVVTRRAQIRRRIAARTLDLDHVLDVDRWEVIDPVVDSMAFRALEFLEEAPGTVIVWETLDRVLPEGRSDGGWARRRLDLLAKKTSSYLGMVFHRFLEGEGGDGLTITINGEKVRPWNPFAPGEELRVELPPKTIEVVSGGLHGKVRVRPFVLPPRSRFSTLAEFERLSGPLKWNRQQGFYIYRADRMIQSGGWCGMRAADEHTKLARAALDFGTELDPLFRISVSKMRVTLPPETRPLLERPVQELCNAAENQYRRDVGGGRASKDSGGERTQAGSDARGIGGALLAAALECGEAAAFMRVRTCLERARPELASALGWLNTRAD
jgi:hypothetical protein